MKSDERREQVRIVATVTPRKVTVPHKVMQHRKLHCRRRSTEVVAPYTPAYGSERGKLHNHTHGANQIELPPADKSIHGNGSCL
jgi:hypothetical protein